MIGASLVIGCCPGGLGQGGQLAPNLLLAGVSEAVAGGAGFDDGAVEGEPVDDRRAEARVGEGLGPPGERLVRRDRDGGLLFPLGENLEEKFRAAAIQFHVSEFINAEQVHATVAGDSAGKLLFVGSFDQLETARTRSMTLPRQRGAVGAEGDAAADNGSPTRT